MIVWLASYPRSGNTLLRSILQQSFGLQSFSQYPSLSIWAEKEEFAAIIGHLELLQPWEQFYGAASSGAERVLVKTHTIPPWDDQPFIYVVRDGRLATQSYYAFHRRFHQPKTLSQLILGDDEYGSWSSHFYYWNDRSEAQRLLLRFEELINPDEQLLHKIAAFLNYTGPIYPFHNPFAKLHQLNSDLNRQGSTQFEAIAEWHEWINWLYYQIHGELMNRLGYPIEDTAAPSSAIPQSSIMQDFLPMLVNHLQTYVNAQHRSEQALREKEAVIQQQIQSIKTKDELITKHHHFSNALFSELVERGITPKTRW